MPKLHITAKRWAITPLYGLGAGTALWATTSQKHTAGYPGYFREPYWFSTGLPEISRVTWTGMTHSLTHETQIDGLMQKRRNSTANALELRLTCTNSSRYSLIHIRRISLHTISFNASYIHVDVLMYTYIHTCNGIQWQTHYQTCTASTMIPTIYPFRTHAHSIIHWQSITFISCMYNFTPPVSYRQVGAKNVNLEQYGLYLCHLHAELYI